MRRLILALSVLGILVSAEAAKAGPSTTVRDLSASADQTVLADEATQEEATQQTEDQIGLDKRRRRDVQRRLTGLGFDTKVTGNFDEATRSVITRWQAARGYPKSGYLNKLQHKALLTEIVSATTSASSSDDGDRPRRKSGGGGSGRRYHGGGGGPPNLFRMMPMFK